MRSLRHTLLLGLAIGLISVSTASAVQVFGDDTLLSALNPTTNYGNATSLPVGGTSVGDINRAVIKFDLTGQPLASGSADMNVEFLSAVGSTRIDIYVVDPANAGWGELLATWNTMDGSTAWTGGGGLGAPGGGGYPAGSYDDLTYNFAGYQVHLPISQSIVNGWITNPASNGGLLFKAQFEDGAHQLEFASAETGGGHSAPSLTFIPEPASLSLLALGGLALLARRR